MKGLMKRKSDLRFVKKSENKMAKSAKSKRQ